MRLVGEMLDQVEQRRLGPMNVLEDDYQRALSCEPLEEASYRPAEIPPVTVSLRQPSDLGYAIGDHLGMRIAGQQPGDLRAGLLPCRLPDDLRQRPERDSVTVREAAPDEAVGVPADDTPELVRKA